jgi:DNA-binding MarR family transcriptional regulator
MILQDLSGIQCIFVHSALDDFGLSPNEFRIYAHLARRANKSKEAWPGIDSMAKICRMDKECVMGAIKILEEKLLLSVEKKRGQTNIYRLTSSDTWLVETNKERSTTPNGNRSTLPNATVLPARTPPFDATERKEIQGRRSKEGLPDGGAEIQRLKTEHTKFIKLWMDEYPDFFGFDYDFAGGKDAKAVQRLVKILTADELMRIAKVAWRNQNQFGCKMSTSIAKFQSSFNEIRVAVSKLAPAPVATTEDSWGPEALKRVINGQQRT